MAKFVFVTFFFALLSFWASHASAAVLVDINSSQTLKADEHQGDHKTVESDTEEEGDEMDDGAAGGDEGSDEGGDEEAE